jgi:hypothetical protein
VCIHPSLPHLSDGVTIQNLTIPKVFNEEEMVVTLMFMQSTRYSG